ncbi:uncharacterized protein [Lolium perenne]|uniref:uncharacterized protein n=1 Tax=Lolium perenne TaxID=4522 RepID=UPI0021F503E0|nr:uncharacterized protein LOC127330076 [Lolium perenne]
MSEDTVNGVCKLLEDDDMIHLGNITISSLSRHVRDLWESPRESVIRIEVLVSLAVVVFLFLATFGSHRRRRRNWFIQKGVFAAYVLSSSVVNYTLGSMQSSAVKSSLYSIWAISLLILHGSTDSITAYSLDDNTQCMRLVYQSIIYSSYVGMLVSTLPILPSDDSGIVGYIFCIASFKFAHKITSYQLASISWNMNKLVADYMYDEHKKGEFDPSTMEGCHYLVDWPLNKSKLDARSYATKLTADADEIIDIDKIWRCNVISLSPELKDTCLSFSLFHLLKRRFFGFSCGESKERAHDFVFRGLLSENEDGTTDYNRVFKVIEVELAFMYDFFFTKYAAYFYGSSVATAWSLMSFAACISLAAYAIDNCMVKDLYCQDKCVFVSTTTTDLVITVLILACTALLELLQLLLYWTSIWARVSFVCQHLRGSCFMMRLKEHLSTIGIYCTSNRHYWQHSLGQYSLLQSVSYNHYWIIYFKSIEFSISTYRYLGLVDITTVIHPLNYDPWRVSRKPGKSVELPAEVKEALVSSLKRSDGKIANGKSSLVANGAENLLWACERSMHSDTSCSQRKENQTHLILTWHIATCYCEMATLKYLCPNEGTKLKIHLNVATRLSKYCAYLVVSAPKLLPGHHHDTECVFDAVAGEAAKFLQSSRDKYKAMRNLADSEDTIFQRGVKLGKQLEEIQDITQCWKVLYDFWADMMLYVVPSDNVKEHIEQLAKGGEFITHLWALLSHAGILERQENQQAGSV